MQLLGRRAAVVNLDPANDALPYECAVDVRDLISLEEVQEQEGLGPNGGAPCSAVRQCKTRAGV
jgi:GPN-loop GTPase